MSNFDQSYQNLLRQVHEQGKWTYNRTNIDTKYIPAGMIQVDLRDGFPVLGLRKLPSVNVGIAEAIGFLRGYDNAAQFEALGCNFWRANADETPAWLASAHRKGDGDLGKIYGVQWRKYPAIEQAEPIDQIRDLVNGLVNDPYSRRHMVTAWHPQVVREHMAALPPCHDSFTISIEDRYGVMHLNWRQRSTDLILGTPHNIVCYAFILTLLARLTGYTPGIVTAHLDNVHYYENHRAAVALLLEREPIDQQAFLLFSKDVYANPKSVDEIMDAIDHIAPSDVCIEGYRHHDPIPNLKMAV